MARAIDAARRHTLQILLRMPAGVLRRMAGRPVEIEGNVLDPEMQLILALQRVEGRPFDERPIPSGRRALLSSSRAVGGNLPIGAVTDRDIDGPGGPLRLRFYTPRGLTTTSPALLYAHGGGWIYCDLDSHDAVCRFLAERAGVRVVAVDYRLAPESPFPAALHDVEAAYSFVTANAAGLGIDPDRIAVGGDSAGGNLAAVLAQRAAHGGLGAPPVFQLLIYPGVDVAVKRPSRATFAEFFLTTRFMDLADESYIPAGADRTDPLLSPIYGDLTGLPPAYLVTAGFDPLRDEGEAYAEKLREAGVEVQYVLEPGLIHSFANMVGVGRSGPEAMGRAAAALRRALSTPPSVPRQYRQHPVD
ncbi:alpha/beta hydrolase family protein [Rhodococcus sp. MTM3W5.2]|uniref:alpha/beta hydrolase n=1 Tax=Rhodococcus sp. MTM3W5.2 TaxID=1805827 RepID=UPI0009792E1A|nr:alpha/beta hydrolase [Rhodococcus sp. MTM3W5.2]AQA25990.1 alpha/beta hydrolase family protein [Rhodococcus sp. MTM3W5.2]